MGTQVMHTSTWAASSFTVAAEEAPMSTNFCMLAGLMSYTTTSMPFLTMLEQMPAPILPRPIKPTFMANS